MVKSIVIGLKYINTSFKKGKMTKVEAASQNRRKSRIAIWESGRGVYFLSGPSALLLVAVGEPDNILDDVLPDGVYIQVEGWRDWYILLSRRLPSRSPNPIISTRSRRLQFCDHVPNRRWFKCCLHLFLKLTKKTSNPFAKLSEISICTLPRNCFSRIPSENLTHGASTGRFRDRDSLRWVPFFPSRVSINQEGNPKSGVWLEPEDWTQDHHLTTRLLVFLLSRTSNWVVTPELCKKSISSGKSGSTVSTIARATGIT